MGEKVRVAVLLPATLEVCEFRLSFGLTVAQAVELIAYIFSNRAGPRFEPTGNEDLLACEGTWAGTLLDRGKTVRELALGGVLVDGSRLALF